MSFSLMPVSSCTLRHSNIISCPTKPVAPRYVDDMSNWYVRRSRERFWAKGMEQDKINAYMTLYTALVTVSKVAAPMIPFMTEEIYQNLVRSVDESAPESIHLCDYPVANEASGSTRHSWNCIRVSLLS